MPAPNGVPMLPPSQENNLRQLEQIVHGAFGAAKRYLKPGALATVIFTWRGKPANAVCMSEASIEDVLLAIRHQMQAANVVPAHGAVPTLNLNTPPAASNLPVQGAHNADADNLRSVIRKALPFISGPGSDTARKMLTAALQPPLDGAEAPPGTPLQ